MKRTSLVLLPAVIATLACSCCSRTGEATVRAADELSKGNFDKEAYLMWMQETLPECAEFSEWQDSTGIMPPDFQVCPRTNLLPDPFTFLDGSKVPANAKGWSRRREEIMGLFEDCMWGHFPPKPEISSVEVLEDTAGNGWKSSTVRLSFGPEGRGNVRVRLTIPTGSDSRNGKYPLLLSTTLNGQGDILLSRGYISAGFAGSDFMDDSRNLKQLYPDHDFSKLARRAWLVSIVLDYLETVPEVDMDRIAVYGYSRDGKMMSIAAARDERISALIAGSTGVGGFVPWRFSGERNGGESIESTTRMFPDWFIPQLRFYSGKEDRLPVDANLLLALIAPRAVLMEWGLNDEVASGWAQEQAYKSALPVFELLNAKDRMGLLKVPGFHGSNDMQACIDFLDIQFGRSGRRWEYTPAFNWDFEKWKRGSGTSVNPLDYPENPDATAAANLEEWEKARQNLLSEIMDMLGSKPVFQQVKPYGSGGYGPTRFRERPYSPGQLEPDVPSWVISRNAHEFGWTKEDAAGVSSSRIKFGPGNLQADLYYPSDTKEGTRLPAVIWLHGFHYPLGYMWVYRNDLNPILALVKEGYAVLAFDQTGFGSRWDEYGSFYERWPQWSRLGRMVMDVSDAIDALQQQSIVDGNNISVFGFSMGGTVGLYAAALDDRISNVVSVCGFTPMRSDTAGRNMSGMTRYSHLYGMVPRLGFFAGHESRIPYDFEDLIAMTAPRGVLIVQPSMDRDASAADVRDAVGKASRIFGLCGAGQQLELQEPDDIGRMSISTQINAIKWLEEHTR